MRGGTCVRHPQCKQLIFNYLNLIRKALRTAREMGTEFRVLRGMYLPATIWWSVLFRALRHFFTRLGLIGVRMLRSISVPECYGVGVDI